MRKLAIVLAGMMVSGLAMAATIVGTAHDLSSYSADNEVCIYCHTPHDADLTVAVAPLWNHAVSTASFTTYTGLDMEAAPGQPAGISLLCLSCHDGTVALDSYGAATGDNYIQNIANTTAYVGTDLRNDHPVGINYANAQLTDGELVDEANPAVVPLLMAGNVECASCHDVHNDTIQPFLVMSNAASALCRTCHVK